MLVMLPRTRFSRFHLQMRAKARAYFIFCVSKLIGTNMSDLCHVNQTSALANLLGEDVPTWIFIPAQTSFAHLYLQAHESNDQREFLSRSSGRSSDSHRWEDLLHVTQPSIMCEYSLINARPLFSLCSSILFVCFEDL